MRLLNTLSTAVLLAVATVPQATFAQRVSILEQPQSKGSPAGGVESDPLNSTRLSEALGIPAPPSPQGDPTAGESAAASQTEELPLPAPAEDLAPDNLAPATGPVDPPTPAAPQSVMDSTASGAATIPPAQPTESQFVTGAPMHEAFVTAAQPVVRAGAIVPFAPPPPVEELRSLVDREGTNVAWIKGYWAWHDDMFVWITGLNREIPPGRRWVPGQWNQTAGGYQWHSGFWADAKSDAVAVVPRPPEHTWLLPPQGIADGSFWMPSGYQWQGNQFVLKQGYSSRHQPKFVWQPSTYVQTPTGFVFVSGYWDFALSLRGTPLAPTAIARDQLAQPLQFTPNVALASDATLLSHLFVRRNDHHLYFADFASAADPSLGVVPWYSAEATAVTASPFRSYYAWNFARQGISFDAAVAAISATYTQQPSLDIRPRVGRSFGDQVSVQDSIAAQFASFDDLVARRPAASQVAQSPVQSQSPAQGRRQASPVPLASSNLGAQTQPSAQLELRSSARIAITPFGIITPFSITPTPGLTRGVRPPSNRSPIASTAVGPRVAIPIGPALTPPTLVRPPALPPLGISRPGGFSRPPIPGPGFRRFGR